MVSARTTFPERAATKTASLAPLGAILAAGLVLRLLFIGGSGFHNDIAAFDWNHVRHQLVHNYAVIDLKSVQH